MAYNGASLSSSSESLKRTVKNLLNADLKAVLKTEGLGVSGVKATLQQRLFEHNIVASEDLVRLDNFASSVEQQVPGRVVNTQSSSHLLPTHSLPVQHKQSSAPAYSHSFLNSHVAFKPSPFYQILQNLTRSTNMIAAPNSKLQTSAVVQLSQQQSTQILHDRSLRVMVYCGADNDPVPKDVSFPASIELKGNNELFSGNLRGIKKRPGTTKPADVTAFMRLVADFKNTVSINYGGTDKPFSFIVNLVKKTSVEDLVDRIRKGSVITKESVIGRMVSKANDPDIVATSSIMSLKCPLSGMRMEIPCRSTLCNHNQCFDATSFLQLQEQAPQWTCPICNTVFDFSALVIDQYVENILKSTSSSTSQVVVEPKGSWRLQEAQSEARSARRSNGMAGSLDDEIIEVVDQRVNGVKTTDRGPSTPNVPLALTSREASASTARSSKRKSEVVDLTLSDDEQLPRRPMKRQSTGSQPLRNGNNVAQNPPSAPPMQSRPHYSLPSMPNVSPGPMQQPNQPDFGGYGYNLGEQPRGNNWTSWR